MPRKKKPIKTEEQESLEIILKAVDDAQKVIGNENDKIGKVSFEIIKSEMASSDWRQSVLEIAAQEAKKFDAIASQALLAQSGIADEFVGLVESINQNILPKGINLEMEKIAQALTEPYQDELKKITSSLSAGFFNTYVGSYDGVTKSVLDEETRARLVEITQATAQPQMEILAKSDQDELNRLLTNRNFAYQDTGMIYYSPEERLADELAENNQVQREIRDLLRKLVEPTEPVQERHDNGFGARQNAWEFFPEGSDDRQIIELWCSNWTNAEIGKYLHKERLTITNRISILRKFHPEAGIPTAEQRRKMLKS